MTDRVLVAYGTKYGATAEIAEVIATTLRTAGFEVDALPARDVRSLEGYQAVVLGSASNPRHSVRVATDGLRPFTISVAAP